MIYVIIIVNIMSMTTQIMKDLIISDTTMTVEVVNTIMRAVIHVTAMISMI